MNNLLFLAVMLVIASVLGCTSETPQPGGIEAVDIFYFDTLDEGCRIRYRIQFSDSYDNENSTSYYYWPALADPSIRAIVAVDTGAYFTPPFNDMNLYLDVTPDWKIAQGSKLYARVYRSSNTDGFPDTKAPCGSSTDGFLNPSFDDHCYPFNIAVTANGANVEEAKCVYLDNTPTLPALGAAITDGDVTGQVDWSLKISYSRSGRTDAATFRTTLDAATTWAMTNELGDNLRGGQAVVTCTPQDTSKGSRSFAFAIRGINPPEATIINYIASLSGVMWYHRYVAKHESGYQAGRHYLQFNEEPLSDDSCGDAADVRYTPNAAGDGGFGLYQLTWFDSPARVPNVQELWDWQENVNSGTEWLTHHQAGANAYMAIQRYWCDQWWLGIDYPVPDEQLGAIVFSDNMSRRIEQAVAMKRYNGASGGQYVEWNDVLHDWYFNRLNTYNPPFNYVERVCLTYP